MLVNSMHTLKELHIPYKSKMLQLLTGASISFPCVKKFRFSVDKQNWRLIPLIAPNVKDVKVTLENPRLRDDSMFSGMLQLGMRKVGSTVTYRYPMSHQLVLKELRSNST
eukprot:TRINITY_DN7562_c0_g1_i1.p1 TRINITY_DN7562_c0_g1~~TRINITY_DN7562_c0_g1_i1.p1  ORF type:complete len:110 (+),score=5.14 TRINITY_DN7562_c0_g1_i1:335-664(+)